MSEGPVKRVKLEDEPQVLIARLVIQYGFCCVKDMWMFAQAFRNKAFLEWAKQHVFVYGIIVANMSTITRDACFHRCLVGSVTISNNVLQDRPAKWHHVYHIRVDKQTSWINQFASTFVVEKPFSIQSQIGYVEGNRLVEGIQKILGNPHPVKVDHSRHSEEDYHFVVLMKWE